MEDKPAMQSDVEIDVGALLSSLWRKLPYIIVFVGIVVVGTYMALARLDPVYKSEASVIIESGESDLTRTGQANQTPVAAPDQQAIASQIQLIRSREVAEAVAKQLDLRSRPEFDETLAPPSTVNEWMQKLGLKSAPGGSVDDRVLKAYYGKLDVYAVAQSRVIGIDFSSTDPKLAADAANAVADSYLSVQRAAKRDTTSNAVVFLANQIDDLRSKVMDAEGKVASFKAQNDLFTGSGQSAATLPQQQLADLNAELTKVRGLRNDAQTKADQIRAALKSGASFNVPEVLNSALIQGLIQQQVALKAQIAQSSATLLPQHPRMKELNAQLGDLDKQIAAQTSKILDFLDSEASLAAAREDAITKSLAGLKTTAAKAGAAGVQLAALEREASAQRDLLDQYLRSYREAVAREQTDYLPADARVVSRASVPIDPDFPKKLPMSAAAGAAALVLTIAFVLLSELASGRPMRRVMLAEPMAVAPRRSVVRLEPRRSIEAVPAEEAEAVASASHRLPPAEPTLAPVLAGRIEQSLQAVAGDILAKNGRRIIVTRAPAGGARPLAALALARELGNHDGRVVLVDFTDDGANTEAVGEGEGSVGLADVFDGTASFSEVLFRDPASRVHFVPAGTRRLSSAEVADERLETILSALTLTYDQVVLDVRDEIIARLAGSSDAAMVVSEFPASDSRTEQAAARVRSASRAEVHLLIIDGHEGDGLQRADAAEAVA